MVEMNNQEYWNKRFQTNWNEFGGEGQTRYFAEILCEMLPEWLIEEVNEKKDAICDIGCAEGDSLEVYYRTFPNTALCGEDFSEVAIERAKQKFPQFSFKNSNILKPEGENQYPVVICSNVLEHFKDTYDVLEKLCSRSTKYTVILIPYRELAGRIPDHEQIFSTDNIPVNVGENVLVYTKSMETDPVHYGGEQILLIYAKNAGMYMLSDLTENISNSREKKMELELCAQIQECVDLINQMQPVIEQLEKTILSMEEKSEK